MMSFAIWITGLPASGKSTITEALQPRLEAAGLQVEVLESDTLRRLLTPSPFPTLSGISSIRPWRLRAADWWLME